MRFSCWKKTGGKVVKVGGLRILKTPPMKGLVTRGYDGFFD